MMELQLGSWVMEPRWVKGMAEPQGHPKPELKSPQHLSPSTFVCLMLELVFHLVKKWLLSSVGSDLKFSLVSTQNPFLEFERSQGKVRLGHMLPLVARVITGEPDWTGELLPEEWRTE